MMQRAIARTLGCFAICCLPYQPFEASAADRLKIDGCPHSIELIMPKFFGQYTPAADVVSHLNRNKNRTTKYASAYGVPSTAKGGYRSWVLFGALGSTMASQGRISNEQFKEVQEAFSQELSRTARTGAFPRGVDDYIRRLQEGPDSPATFEGMTLIDTMTRKDDFMMTAIVKLRDGVSETKIYIAAMRMTLVKQCIIYLNSHFGLGHHTYHNIKDNVAAIEYR